MHISVYVNMLGNFAYNFFLNFPLLCKTSSNVFDCVAVTSSEDLLRRLYSCVLVSLVSFLIAAAAANQFKTKTPLILGIGRSLVVA